MRVILSRKGYDSSFGSITSLVLHKRNNTDEIIMLPIPCDNDTAIYNDLKLSEDKNFFEKLIKLPGYEKLKNKKCHADPNLVDFFCDKESNGGFVGSIGPHNTAYSHLRNQGVTVGDDLKDKDGDLFIFYGVFREAHENGDGSISLDDCKKRHMMFGYLQIGEDISNENIKKYTEEHKWMKNQPHSNLDKYKDNSNHIFVAREKLSFAPELNGYGMFNFSKDNQLLYLTKNGSERLTDWHVEGLKNRKISWNAGRCFDENGDIQVAKRGQEFVLEGIDEAEKWAIKLIKKFAKR